MVGTLYLSQFRAGLIEARVQSLVVQGEIIAGAIAASGTSDTYGNYGDRDRGLDLPPIENYGDDGLTGLEFSINPERVAPILRRLISPTKTRARIYDRNGYLILDSRNLYLPGEVVRLDLPPPNEQRPNYFQRQWNKLRLWFGRGDLPRYHELGAEAGKDYSEVAEAVNGAQSAYMVRVTDAGEVIVSVAVPVQRFRAVRGALLLSTQGGDINQAVEAERLQIVKLFFILLGVMVVLSVLLARTIAGPVKRLADGAERVRHRIRSRVEIPDFTARGDEIGDLSGALRDMTNALYSRIEAIESFAADVAHELKNPLTSLRSAVDGLGRVDDPALRARLMEIVADDVHRLDRLISDISDASRLDAQLSRATFEAVDLSAMVGALIAERVARGIERGVTITFDPGDTPLIVLGEGARLERVFANLIDNAISFSPDGGIVSVGAARLADMVELAVEDEGPGVPPDAREAIFRRFHSVRPSGEEFGRHSGLGLAIARTIVEAHQGQIGVEARDGLPDGARAGARFVVRLPVTDAE